MLFLLAETIHIASPLTEGDVGVIAKIANASIPFTGTEVSDVPTGTAAIVDNIDEKVSKVHEVGAQNFTDVANSSVLDTAFVSPVPEASEQEAASDPVEKDEGALARSTELEPTALLSNELGARVSDSVAAEPVSVSGEILLYFGKA